MNRSALAFCIRTLIVSVIAVQAADAYAADSGAISGRVTDAAGKAVVRAVVTVRDASDGVARTSRSDNGGYYTFPALPVGSYTVQVNAPGFAMYTRTGIMLDTSSALVVNPALTVGAANESVTVSDHALHVETTSTQQGQVITGRQIRSVPLDGRSYTDLLPLQPGVAPETAITNSTVQDVGATILNPSGTLNPGNISINGQRETANYFSVNGSDVEENMNAGTAVIPNLDSIAEFRILTSSLDAENGEYSGGHISVVTRSGTNTLHGSAFDFVRNTSLDARNYFSPTRGAYHQNQFGGTLGGPVRRDRLFFFVDYQGTHQTQGIDTGTIAVPSVADRTGNLADYTTGANGNQLNGLVSGPYFATLLTQRLGYNVVSGEPYYLPGCISSSTCVFPGALIPQSAWSVPAQRMLQYIPAPNTAGGTFATSAYDQQLTDDKGGARVDANTRLGQMTGYYFIDNFYLLNPYPVAQSGSSVPGFAAATSGRAQLYAFGDTRTFGSTLANELHVSYMRDTTNLGQPIGGRGVSLASQGFVNADGSDSIVALDPKGQSVENLNFNAYSTGAAANQLIQVNNTYQIADNVSKVLGRHTFTFGAEFHADQVNGAPIAQFNGSFVFSGQETGVDFADFLVGVPSQYNQSQLNPFYGRNKYLGLFAQDSWRPTDSLTLNYGLRWDRIAPWSERYNQISTFVPGAQSRVFPGAPAGILYPGDPGMPNTLAPVDERNFAPRLGIAWSPVADDGPLHTLLGGRGASSVRAGFGLFYTAIDATSIGVLAANAPYGTTYSSPAPPLFATPFVSAADGTNYGQPFPYTFAPLDSSRSHPDANIDWPTYEPISGIPGYDIHNHTPYTEEWSLTLERQVGPGTVLSAGYVGSENHRQTVLMEANPGDPTLCLSLSQPSEVAYGTVTCGAYGEDTVYTTAAGTTVDGTRTTLGPNFGSNALQANIGHGNYNALELSARHVSGRLEFDAAYTYSKSMDISSNFGEAVNPFDPPLDYALSSFDLKHNFVVSYDYQLPFDQLLRPSRLTRGWSLSGITHIATGFPVTMINNGDNSLIGSNPNGVNNSSIDEPDYNGGALALNHDPRTHGNAYFATADFSMNALGTPGTAKRRFFYGPGLANYDMAVAKQLPLKGAASLMLRAEAFNVFNHTQFFGPQSVDGDIGSSTFGNVVSAASPRILQGALKLSF